MIPYHDYEGAEYEYPPHEEVELKPCPFCGCTSISMFEHIDYDGTFYVMCDSCGATLGTALDNIALTEEEITELWNKRVVAEMTDKTCTNVGTDYADTDQFVCSACGVHLEEWVSIDEDGDAHEYTFRFCPHCGARVVEE